MSIYALETFLPHTRSGLVCDMNTHSCAYRYVHLMTHIYGHIRRHLSRSTSIFATISPDTFRKTPPFSPPYPPAPVVRHSHTYLHHRHHLPYDTFIVPPFSLRFLASPPIVHPSQKHFKTHTNFNIKNSHTLVFFCKVLSFFYIL